MSFVNELYQEVILDHNRQPRNYGDLPDATEKAEGYNPLCGDRVTVYIKRDGDVIQDVKFVGAGCAISTASASLMTETLKGKNLAQARVLFEKFRDMVMGNLDMEMDDEDLEKLVVFHRLSDYPVRVKCATLVWHALLSALEKEEKAVSTE
ncbi:MAG: SUF system NifU family Fe-S cluster assembly protein [Acidobacteriota bacterium]|nr:MAG: SUF system NifU family Fe-S cluster assembly protein [Acidobacteriota bacterium]